MKRLVVWGGTRDLSSHRWIHRAYLLNAQKLGIDAVQIEDGDGASAALRVGDVVLAADIWSDYLVAVPGVRYVLHNFSGDHPLCESLAETPERLLRLQVWTHDATGARWDDYRQFDRKARTLFQPWGSDLLAEEFLEPVFNALSRDVTFVGAVWAEPSPYGELGNVAVIDEVREGCKRFGLKFRHVTQIGQGEMVAVLREARLAPAFAGGWQVQHGYLPCRVFKNVAYGTLAFTNIAEAETLLSPATVGDGSVEGTLSEALALSRGRYLALVREQQRQVARYTYRESLQAIERALEEIA